MSLCHKIFCSLVLSTVYASTASATKVASVPEIDGPAGIAAIAMLVSAGIIAYNRLTK